MRNSPTNHTNNQPNATPTTRPQPVRRSQRPPLQQRLLVAILPTVLLSLVISGLFGYNTARNRGRQTALNTLKQDTSLTAQTTSALFEEKLRIANVIGLNPVTKTVFKQAKSQVDAGGLIQKPIADLEKQFEGTHQLPSGGELNDYLREIAQSNDLAEVLITDPNGFTVAAAKPTSDFVQRDEQWWQDTVSKGSFVDRFQFDESVKQVVVALSRKITNPRDNEFLGVLKLSVNADQLSTSITKAIQQNLKPSEKMQLVEGTTGKVINTIAAANVILSIEESQQLIGGTVLEKLAASIAEASQRPIEADELTKLRQNLQADSSVQLVSLDTRTTENTQQFVSGALVRVGNYYYDLTPVPQTSLVAIGSASIEDVEVAGRELLVIFTAASLALGLVMTLLVQFLAKQLSQPLTDLTKTSAAVARGDLSVRAKLQGTAETETLANGLNGLLDQVQSLLQKQQDASNEQRRQREELERDVVQLMDDVSDAADGDLTVRAQLTSGDVGIVADLFNSIIENLRDTAMQVKLSSGQVSTSLDVNASAIRSLSSQAITEAESLRSAMGAVEQMSDSIQVVASNAAQATNLTDQTYNTIQDSSRYMEQTVDSILSLRSTVGETAKKIKRLGESAQKISQTVSLIDEIALKTNLLAVNASVEAARAGELGHGFTAVAEQVGALAEQSAKATKEIALIVTAIQMETQEVVAAIETGTAQVVDSTQLVEATKQRLTQVLEKSAQINQLMQAISTSTMAQRQTSAMVTDRVKTATISSEQRSQSSEQMARAIQDTAAIARSMQASVAQFKVSEPTSSPPEDGIDPIFTHSDSNDSTAPSAVIVDNQPVTAGAGSASEPTAH
jgi:methyl-accepting chemotaxis protein PixJ